MTIWLLALIVLASCAGLGYRQGAIRVGFSFFGILLGALLAVPLGNLIKPLLMSVGLKNPTLVWALAPVIIFVAISALFKAVALPVHQKVDVHYKYRAGDLKLTLWERLSQRLGLCLGLLNGAAYLILISFGIYAFSYWTFQIQAEDGDPTSIKVLNRLGKDLQSTGFAKVAASIDRLPESYYDAADLVGVLYNNPLSEARLTRYPALLALAEKPEIADIAADQSFTAMRHERKPLMEVLDYPKVQAVLKNAELVHTIWATIAPELKDIPVFLETGRAPKYEGEKILGRWLFEANAALNAVRRARPNLPPQEMQKIKRWLAASFSKTAFVAAPDHEAFLKNIPRTLTPSLVPATDTQTLPGQWKNLDANKYQVTYSSAGNKEVTATVEGDRLTMNLDGMEMVFSRED